MGYATYQKGNDYDNYFVKLIRGIKKKIVENNDDFLLVCVGVTGSGKSNLSLHGYELYDADNMSINNIAFKESDFADRLEYVSKQEHLKFLCYDEANVNKRNSMKTWNKDLIDIYFSIRGKNILHWWNNPSVEMIDKAFVKEKINGLIYVATKSKDKPRIYYFFRKEDLLKILYNENDCLTLDKLASNRRNAFYIGCFKKYKGKLLDAYLCKKEERMDCKITDFKNKYGTKEVLLNASQIARKLNMSNDVVYKLINKYIKEDKLLLNTHYIINGVGQKKFKEEAINLFDKNKQSLTT